MQERFRIVAVIVFLLGIALLVVGAELTVRGSARVAAALGVTPMVIGLTIVSIGTSAPELAVGITASFQGKGAIAVGNIAGTNVLNLLLILCLSALLRPLPLQMHIFKLELPMIVVAAGLMTVLAWDGLLSRFDGCLMFVVGILYSIVLIRVTRTASRAAMKEYREEYGQDVLRPTRWWERAWLPIALAAGIVLTVLGADCLVRGVVDIAQSLNVSTAFIGLTIVAVGTSAPELVTTIMSTIKNDRDVAIGNLLGSSIYNILLILSLTCMISPGGLPVEEQLLLFDIPLMAGVAIGAVPVFVTGKQVTRLEGALGICIYVTYLLWLILSRT